MTYKCTYDIGNGVARDGGVWDVKATPKMLIFRQTIAPFFSTPWRELRCRKDNASRHALRDWHDGTYTVYPDRSGIPYVFLPLPQEET